MNIGIVLNKSDVKNWIECDDKDSIIEKSFTWKLKLRLGKEVYINSEDVPRKLKKGEFIVIKPGEFVLLMTKESINLPRDVMAFISMRFDFKQKGLINVSGFHVDPDYEGKLIFSAFHAGSNDIIIQEGEKIFMIFFQRLPHEIEKRKEKGFDRIPSNMVEEIRGRNVTLSSNAGRLDKLEFYFKLLGGLMVASFSLLLALALRGSKL